MSKELRTYGAWAGYPQGVKEDITRCIVEVWPQHGMIPSQCARKRGFGPGGTLCKQHAKKVERAAV